MYSPQSITGTTVFDLHFYGLRPPFRIDCDQRWWLKPEPHNLGRGCEKFVGADLRRVDLSEQNLRYKKFNDADCRGATFHRSEMTLTDFRGAILDAPIEADPHLALQDIPWSPRRLE